MNEAKRSNAEVLDILFAVALGEGFITGLYEYKSDLLSGAVFTFAEPGQGMFRILLTFLIIILSWLHFRSSTLSNPVYPRGEFVVDVLVAMSYMTLFLFVDEPVAFYALVGLVWMLYTIARVYSGLTQLRYLAFSLLFVVLFATIAVSAAVWDGAAAEWSRLVLLTIAVVAYRPLDRVMTRNVSATRD